MYSCEKCGKLFTRKDNAVRHLKTICKAKHSSKKVSYDTDQEQNVSKSDNDIAVDVVDVIGIMTSAFAEQRRKWKHDFKKFQNEIKHKETSEDKNMVSSDEENESTDEDTVSSD